jgi:hypothetical protein
MEIHQFLIPVHRGKVVVFKRWKLIGAVSHSFTNPKKQVAFQTMQGSWGFTIPP